MFGEEMNTINSIVSDVGVEPMTLISSHKTRDTCLVVTLMSHPKLAMLGYITYSHNTPCVSLL